MDQKAMEAFVEKTMNENNIKQADTFNGMMRSENMGCSFEDKTITFGFPVQPWQANRAGMLHGGAICAAFDLTIAAVARFFSASDFIPTVSIDVKFIRPVKIGDRLIVTAKAVAPGRRITQLTAEAVSESTGKLAATAASIYLNINERS